jgi:hypothetical protein
MHLIVSLIAILIGFTSLPVVAQSGRTFYIDYASGSNSNPGTKASPWKTHPYMQTSSACTGSGSAPSYSHQAGDQFIFKGGVSWPAACFQMTITAGGTASAVDYYGVDQTWFVGSSWTRPLFDFAHQFPGSGNHAIATSGAGQNSAGLSYITIDNFEIANMNTHLSSTDVAVSAVILMGGMFAATQGSVGTTLENSYIHDWFTTENICTNGQTGNNCTPTMGYGTVWGVALVDNVELNGDNGYLYYQNAQQSAPLVNGCEGCGELRNSKVHGGFAGCSSCKSVHDNEFYNIQQSGPAGLMGIHTHIVYEDNQSVQDTVAVFNNAIHDSLAGLIISVYYQSAIYNNVIWNQGNNVGIQLESLPSDNSSMTGYVFHNTIDLSNETVLNSCYGWASGYPAGKGTLYLKNNICIPNGTGTGGYSVATQEVSNNIDNMSTSEAAKYGFTPANKYNPTSSDPNVARKGVNLMSSLSSSLTSILAPLQNDTAGAPWFGRAYKQRSTWDLGAFVVGNQSASSKPNPPSGLAAVVQ